MEPFKLLMLAVSDNHQGPDDEEIARYEQHFADRFCLCTARYICPQGAEKSIFQRGKWLFTVRNS